MIQPTHVAMSIGKVGEVFFWLGSGQPAVLVAGPVGEAAGDALLVRTGTTRSRPRGVSVGVAPLDLRRLLGIVALPRAGCDADV